MQRYMLPCILLLLFTPCRAQKISPITTGTLVRVTSPTFFDRPTEGRVVLIKADTLVVKARLREFVPQPWSPFPVIPPSPWQSSYLMLRIPFEKIFKCEVSKNWRIRRRNGFWGAGLGLFAGAIPGMAIRKLGWAAGGGGSGALVGFFVGIFANRWQEVSLPYPGESTARAKSNSSLSSKGLWRFSADPFVKEIHRAGGEQ